MEKGKNYKNCSIKQVKHYFLIKEIGKGTSAHVYSGVNSAKDELVAIKVIPAEYLEKNNGAINLKRELNTLHKLDHKNIIKIKDYVETKRNKYIIMEYCNGRNLADFQRNYIKKNKIQLNEFFIQKIMRQISDGLEYMHSKNIIHRDIKLDNILINFNKFSNYATKGLLPPSVDFDKISLNDSFTIKIADLGYSKEISSLNLGSTVLGTPNNMSPDVINNLNPNASTKGYNSSVDLWSLGTITYQLLTGRPPFLGNSYKEIFTKILEGKYTLPSKLKVSIELITFINGLLQYYPEKRLNWPQIRNHPFLTKNVKNFTFIELNQLGDEDTQNIEMNSKDYDNLLWVLFRGKGLNFALDKINLKDNNTKEELKKSLKNSVIDNEEIQQALEEEKKKIEEDKNRLEKEKIEAEKLKKEAEELKKQADLIKEKNELKKAKIEEAKKKKDELEKELKLKKEKEHIIQKKLNDCQKLILEAEEDNKTYEEKVSGAKKLLLQGEKMKEKSDNDLKNIKEIEDLEEKNRKDEEKLKEIKRQQLLEEEKKCDKKIEEVKKIIQKNEKGKDLKEYINEEENLKKLKDDIKNQAKDIKVNIFDIENNHQNEVDIEGGNLKINDMIKKIESNDFSDWVFYNGEQDAQSIDMDDKEDDKEINENVKKEDKKNEDKENPADEFEIINFENDETKEVIMKKLEI